MDETQWFYQLWEFPTKERSSISVPQFEALIYHNSHLTMKALIHLPRWDDESTIMEGFVNYGARV